MNFALFNELHARSDPHAPALAMFRKAMTEKFFEETVNATGERPRDPRGDYVGGERCCDCHADVGAQHAASPHGVPSAALLASDFAGSTSCVACHTDSDDHDMHATALHLLGLDHEKLTYRYAGRDFRLTDVHGEVVHSLVA